MTTCDTVYIIISLYELIVVEQGKNFAESCVIKKDDEILKLFIRRYIVYRAKIFVIDTM